MKSKLQRKIDGPGWFEVIFGAALSAVLGVVLAVVFLVLKPVTEVKELPKDPIAKMVYYVEGTRETSKTRELSAKRRLIADAASVGLNEDEINTLVMPAVAAPTPKVMELPQPAPTTGFMTPGLPNFRIREGVMQIGVPIQLNALELQQKVILQMRGGFRKDAETVVFAPGELFVGSLPLEHVPAAKDALLKYLFAKAAVPEELVNAWRNVSDATIDGSILRLTAR